MDPSDEAKEHYLEMVRDARGLAEEIRARCEPLLTAEEFADKLGCSVAEVRGGVAAHRLLSLKLEDREEPVLPGWQIENGRVLRGLDSVQEILRAKDEDDFSIAIFLTYPCEELEPLTPLQALRRGKIQAVCDAARREGEMSF